MALIPTSLKAELTTLFTTLSTNQDGDAGRQQFIDGLTSAIDTYIRMATVNVTVVTAGSATNQTGTGTGVLS